VIQTAGGLTVLQESPVPYKPELGPKSGANRQN